MMEASDRRHHGPAIFEGEPAVDAVLKQDQNVESIPENARRLLEEYSGIKPDEVIPSVVALVGLDVLKASPFQLKHKITVERQSL